MCDYPNKLNKANPSGMHIISKKPQTRNLCETKKLFNDKNSTSLIIFINWSERL